MLRPYKLIYHPIHRAQSFVNYIFLEVVCKAPARGRDVVFSPDMVKVERFRTLLEGVSAALLLNPLSRIYEIVKLLPPPQVKVIKRAVLVNNRIRELCCGMHKPVLYKDLAAIDRVLASQVRLFCSNYYEKVTNRAVFRRVYADLDSYYKGLVRKKSICSVCGVNKIMSEDNTPRDAFDHYLPQGKFPFVSLNFYNLVPMCGACNSSYKHAKNTIYVEQEACESAPYGRRVKAFYPFRREKPDISLAMDFRQGCGLGNLSSGDIDLRIGSVNHPEETENWNRIFGIEENYKSVCASEIMFSYMEEYFKALHDFEISPARYIDSLKSNRNRHANFLRIPFLESISRYDVPQDLVRTLLERGEE